MKPVVISISRCKCFSQAHGLHKCCDEIIVVCSTCYHCIGSIGGLFDGFVYSFAVLDDFSIGGFHVTHVSLIITQVENKIAYHSIN